MTCLYVLIAMAPAHKINVNAWYRDKVTFTTLKHRLLNKTKKTKKNLKLAS